LNAVSEKTASGKIVDQIACNDNRLDTDAFEKVEALLITGGAPFVWALNVKV
jgi:hypothetical protein